jgi:hypothetical protein
MRHVGPRSRLSVYASSISLTLDSYIPRSRQLAPRNQSLLRTPAVHTEGRLSTTWNSSTMRNVKSNDENLGFY